VVAKCASGSRPRRHRRAIAVFATMAVFGLVSISATFTVARVSGAPVSGGGAGTGGFALADGRSWAQTSPINKHGSGLEAISQEGGVIQAAESGEAITYIANGPLTDHPEGNTALEYQQALSRLTPSGWVTKDITTPNSTATEIVPGNTGEYPFFSPDLSRGLLEPKGESALPPLPEGSEKTPYLRDNAAGTFEALVTAQNVVPGAEFGNLATHNTLVAVGTSGDLAHTILTSEEALTTGSVRDIHRDQNLYEWQDGGLEMVSILPPNSKGEELAATAIEIDAKLGWRNNLVRSAVSEDGSRVVFATGSRRGEVEAHEFDHLYLRDTARHETVQVDKPSSSAGAAENPLTYQGASTDGSRIFFADEKRLTTDSQAAPKQPDLYVFELTPGGGPLSGKVTDLTTGAPEGGPGGFEGALLGYSRDGTDVYFVATGALAPGATTGNNLYVEHFRSNSWGQPQLIAALSGEDASDWGGKSRQSDLSLLTGRVAPSGRYAAFMSNRPLTGFDNRNSSGIPEQEVFLFDDQLGTLICASCSPTGERPTGIFDEEGSGRTPLVDRSEANGSQWLSGSVPGWTAYTVGEAHYQSRYLNDQGILFFNSADALVPGDANGEEDVYEYEPEGPRCNVATQSAAEVFRLENGVGGCVALMSSGASSQESAFLDASASGDDIFFLTAAHLAPSDVDSAYDIYDAHVCSSVSPCPAAAPPPVPCAEADACRGAALGKVESGGVVGSEQLSGMGNLRSGPGNAKPAPSLAERRTAALRACRKRFGKKKRRRHACESAARRRYRSKAAGVGVSDIAGGGR
jgi:hypothetical protein